MRKLAFSALFFSAIAWLWIGRIIAADGILVNVSGTTVAGGSSSSSGILSTTNGAAASGRVWVTTNGTEFLGTNYSGAVVVGGMYGTNAFVVDVPGTPGAISLHTNGAFYINGNAGGLSLVVNSGALSFVNSQNQIALNSGGLGFSAGNAFVMNAYSDRLELDSAKFLGWSASVPYNNTAIETAFARHAAGTVVLTNKTVASTYGSLIANAYMIGQVNTTAGTANNWTSNNIYCGRVRISSGSQSYFVTNTAVTTSSMVLANVNTADATAFSCQAIPTSGLLQLKLNGVAAGDCDISWRIVSP